MVVSDYRFHLITGGHNMINLWTTNWTNHGIFQVCVWCLNLQFNRQQGRHFIQIFNKLKIVHLHTTLAVHSGYSLVQTRFQNSIVLLTIHYNKAKNNISFKRALKGAERWNKDIKTGYYIGTLSEPSTAIGNIDWIDLKCVLKGPGRGGWVPGAHLHDGRLALQRSQPQCESAAVWQVQGRPLAAGRAGGTGAGGGEGQQGLWSWQVGKAAGVEVSSFRGKKFVCLHLP